MSQRLLSLDAFRGFTMLWLAGGAGFVRSFQKLFDGPAFAAIAAQFQHSHWEGLRFWDTVMPAFLFMVGMSVPWATARRAETQSRAQVLLHACRRAAIIFLLGSLRESLSLGEPFLIELSSTLQPIAVSYLICVLLAPLRPWVQWLTAALFLAIPGAVMAFIAAPGIPAGSYARELNISFWLDLQVLGRTHQDVWGTVLTEWLIPPTAIFGMRIGALLLAEGDRAAKLRRIVWMGIAAVALGLALSPWVPVIMRLWTPSYGILSAGVACLQFALFFWLIDVKGWSGWTLPLIVIGTNALAAYLLPTIIPISKHVGVFTAPAAAALGPFGPVLRAGSVLTVHWLILFWLYRRNIFLRP
ncbi:MAG: DUF1624 domain-containing protein [Bryobacterales bacterium]|nr:DUF1624 domain-containing protein [Bryobacterales bacterium]